MLRTSPTRAQCFATPCSPLAAACEEHSWLPAWLLRALSALGCPPAHLPTCLPVRLPAAPLQNLIRGRGLFCRSIMKSQMASPAFTPGELSWFPLLLHGEICEVPAATRRRRGVLWVLVACCTLNGFCSRRSGGGG